MRQRDKEPSRLISPLPAVRRLRRRLLRWFDRHRRDLPWRRTRNPYRIWVAEIMLQQTRIPFALPYYRRFVRAFPSVRRLAAARSEQVLALWAGLGYYRRARHLQQAARRILRHHGGRFPARLGQALALPGVGPYTARAVLSMAYGLPVAVVDGNVTRVLARVFRLPLADSATARTQLQPLADRLVSRARPGDFNQALMELGSTLCLPKQPRCQVCPLERLCAARQAGIERCWPPRQARRQRPRRPLAVLVLRRSERLLLVREPGGLFSGLWHFPYTRADGRQLPGELVRYLRRWRGRLESPAPWRRLVHGMTTGDLHLSVYLARVPDSRPEPTRIGGQERWLAIERLVGRTDGRPRPALGAATQKIVAAVAELKRTPRGTASGV